MEVVMEGQQEATRSARSLLGPWHLVYWGFSWSQSRW